MTGIYKIQSISHPNRCYIGSAVNVKSRFRVHKHQLQKNKHHSIKLQRHFNKYGESDLIFILITSCEKGQLIELEQWFIDTNKPYFNNRMIADSNTGIKWTEEAKQRHSINSRGRKCPPRTEEHRKNISLSKIGDKNPMFGKEPANKGKKRPEVAAKLRGRKGHSQSQIAIDNLKERMKNNQYGKKNKGKKKPPFTEEHIRHLSESHKKKVA